MFSFLQQRLGKSPTKPQNNMTRQDSIQSAFARVEARNVSKDASATPSLTTSTSVTDTSSEPTDLSEKPENHAQKSGLSGASTSSYHGNVFHGSLPHTESALGVEKDGPTLLEGPENDSRKRLLKESVQALDEDWNIGAMPGDALDIPMEDLGGNRKRRSVRLGLLDQASTVMDMTTSVLGKRGREAMEAGIEKLKAFKGDKERRGRRPIDTRPTPIGTPRKRARFSATYNGKDLSLQPSKKTNTANKRSKFWVSQGLYVGQSADFDPRLTETKNKLKKASVKGKTILQCSAMPLPMFAGERSLAIGRDFKLPFDVFSPLPPGQPKPDEWKKTHKSMLMDLIALKTC